MSTPRNWDIRLWRHGGWGKRICFLTNTEFTQKQVEHRKRLYSRCRIIWKLLCDLFSTISRWSTAYINGCVMHHLSGADSRVSHQTDSFEAGILPINPIKVIDGGTRICVMALWNQWGVWMKRKFHEYSLLNPGSFFCILISNSMRTQIVHALYGSCIYL